MSVMASLGSAVGNRLSPPPDFWFGLGGPGPVEPRGGPGTDARACPSRRSSEPPGSASEETREEGECARAEPKGSFRATCEERRGKTVEALPCTIATERNCKLSNHLARYCANHCKLSHYGGMQSCTAQSRDMHYALDLNPSSIPVTARCIMKDGKLWIGVLCKVHRVL